MTITAMVAIAVVMLAVGAGYAYWNSSSQRMLLCKGTNQTRIVVHEILIGVRRAAIADGSYTPQRRRFVREGLHATRPIDCEGDY